jgi:DNA-binding NarL/FixJ family response regulator
MGFINVLIADNQFLSAEGLKSLICTEKKFKCKGLVYTQEELFEKLNNDTVHVLVIDYSSPAFGTEIISEIKKSFLKIRILAITPEHSRKHIRESVDRGVCSHLLKDCDRNEIIEAIEATHKGEKFFCSKILGHVLNPIPQPDEAPEPFAGISCEGINISDRETEIITLIAEGFSNKEIAEKLFLSPHTVNTHRKNIMNKIGVNNTAGMIIYALREQIITPNKYLFSSTDKP